MPPVLRVGPYRFFFYVSDGLQARIGSITANQEWFKVWRTIDGDTDAPAGTLELETLVRGVFDRRRFLDLLQHYIAFEENPDTGEIHIRIPPGPAGCSGAYSPGPG